MMQDLDDPILFVDDEDGYENGYENEDSSFGDEGRDEMEQKFDKNDEMDGDEMEIDCADDFFFFDWNEKSIEPIMTST